MMATLSCSTIVFSFHRAGHPSHWACGRVRGTDGHPVPRRYSWQLLLAYDLTGDVSTYAANWRSSALTAPLRQLSAMDADMGSGKISSSPFPNPSKMARATDSGETFGMSRARVISVSTGPG